MEQIVGHIVHQLRSEVFPKEDLEIRLGHSFLSKGSTMAANCSVKLPDSITIDDDDDDVQICSPRFCMEGRHMLSLGRSRAPVIDLELRLGCREHRKHIIDSFGDEEDIGASRRQFDKKSSAAASSSRQMDMRVNLTCNLYGHNEGGDINIMWAYLLPFVHYQCDRSTE